VPEHLAQGALQMLCRRLSLSTCHAADYATPVPVRRSSFDHLNRVSRGSRMGLVGRGVSLSRRRSGV